MDSEFISGYPDLILHGYQTCNYIIICICMYNHKFIRPFVS